MAKELYNAKVETEVKDKLTELTERYTNEGYIKEKGDILNIAAELLQRNLTVQAPRAVVGIEHLDQLTAQINRLFISTIDQNSSFIQTLRQEHDENQAKAQITINNLLEEKQDLKNQLTERGAAIQELTELTKVNQEKAENLENDNKEKSKYITLLEGKNEEFEKRIKELLQLEQQNRELKQDSNQKAYEIESLNKRIQELEAALLKQEQDHKLNNQRLEFTHKEALLNQNQELTEKFNQQLESVRNHRDEFIEKYEARMTALQEKYEALFAEKQKIEAENQILKSNQPTDDIGKGGK